MSHLEHFRCLSSGSKVDGVVLVDGEQRLSYYFDGVGWSHCLFMSLRLQPHMLG